LFGLQKLKILLYRFARARSGAVAQIWALALLGLAPAIAVSADSANAFLIKGAMQDALDSALLAVAKADLTSQAEIDAMAHSFVRANLGNRRDVDVRRLIVTRVAEGRYRGRLSTRISTYLTGILGVDSLRADVDGAVVVSKKSTDVVLALDTTGSMTGSRITALKEAASDFVEDMMKGASVRVGIVPFARYVNIGIGNRNTPGFDIPPNSRSCRTVEREERYNWRNCRNCRTIRHERTCYDDGRPRNCSWTEEKCDCDFDTRIVEREDCDERRWSGCVGSRKNPYNVRDDNSSERIPGIMNYECGTPLLKLTNRKESNLDLIDDLDTNDETYLPAGLSMGWAVLSHRVPFQEGKDPSDPANKDLLRALVLMTDGLNTVSREGNDEGHWGNNTAEANRVSAELCNNIKADGVILFTIAFEVTDTTVKNLLRNCATAPNLAFDATNPQDLKDAFQDVEGMLSRLRLTR
jgi:Mg-chelatase subunit ChlD